MYPPTARTTANRTRDRMSYDRAAAHAVLDEAYHCALGVRRGRRAAGAADPARPRRRHALPARLHRQPAAARRPGRRGLPVCVTVTLLDGLVYARSQFHHSANYRSVVAHGTARLVTDERREERRADRAGGEGRRRARPRTAGRRAGASWPRPPCWRCRCARCRSGPAPAGYATTPADLHLPHWAGVLPLRLTAGPPEPAAGVTAPLPATCGRPASPWQEPVDAARRARAVLEPLDLGARRRSCYAATADAGGLAAPRRPAAGRRRPGCAAVDRAPRWPPSSAASGCPGCSAAP